MSIASTTNSAINKRRMYAELQRARDTTLSHQERDIASNVAAMYAAMQRPTSKSTCYEH